MKLYDVPRNTPIKFTDPEGNVHELFFYHVDGMYSLCRDKDDQPVHLAAWADVEVVLENNTITEEA